MPSSILLKSGTVLIHGHNDTVTPTQTDILIEGNKISKIEKDISPPADAEVIDCSEKLISPGFIDTHHHVWQTQLKGRHADQNLVQYMPTGNYQSSNYSPADFFWGQLGGCLEALDAGTTTIAEHAHLTTSEESVRTALSATISSGIRSIFHYTPIGRIKSWNPLTLHEDLLAPWVLSTLTSLASSSPYANGRVTIGLAFDLWFLPKEMVTDLFTRAKDAGIQHFTAHLSITTPFRQHYIPSLLESYGLLDKQWILSHANNPPAEMREVIKRTGAKISCTPSSELQMAMGQTTAFAYPDLYPVSSLGIDCHSNNAGSIPSEMRLGLQAARAFRNERFIEKEKSPSKIEPSVLEAFNLGTILGARAIGMEESLGSVAVGKIADLVVFDKMSPAMVCAAEHEPLAAIVLHSSPGDIDTVIVDGIVRKRNGKLLDVNVEKDVVGIAGAEKVGWKEVARQLVKSRASIQEKIDPIDFSEATDIMLKMFQVDKSIIVDSV